jgi:hypothetical protein
MADREVLVSEVASIGAFVGSRLLAPAPQTA